MKISCLKKNLLKTLLIGNNIASKTTNLPILNNVLIKAENNLITLAATNLEVGVTYPIAGKIDKEGVFTIPSRILTDYVSLLSDETLELSVKDGVATIKSDNYSTKIKGEPAEDFPLIPAVSRDLSISCPADSFVAALGQTLFSAAPSDLRPELNGVLINVDPLTKQITFAATDSFRLAERKVTITGEANLPATSFIIPVSTVAEVLRVLGVLSKEDEYSADVTIYVDKGQVLFSYQGLEFYSRLIEAKFPEYQQIIPAQSAINCIVDRNDLTQAIRTISIFARKEIYDVVFEFNVEAQRIILSAANDQVGESKVELPVNITGKSANITGKSANITLNYKYLLDGLGNINTGEVIIEASNDNTPCVIKPVLTAPGAMHDYLCLVMPIKQ